MIYHLRNAELCLEVTQYDASQHPSFTAPPGCLQWHTGNIGVIHNFNFKDVNSFHLSSQRYSICWRRERSYCSLCLAVGYFGLSNVPSKAPSSSTTPWTKIAGMSDSICCSVDTPTSNCGTSGANDYIEIEGARQSSPLSLVEIQRDFALIGWYHGVLCQLSRHPYWRPYVIHKDKVKGKK